jgi:hypothetical protein
MALARSYDLRLIHTRIYSVLGLPFKNRIFQNPFFSIFFLPRFHFPSGREFLTVVDPSPEKSKVTGLVSTTGTDHQWVTK